ncbi:MAG: hypothetical protein ACOY3P_25630, partial [Planctomycetota bacterium]
TVWMEGLPGPHHRAYLTRGSLHNIYEGLRSYNAAKGHLPPATDRDPMSGALSSWRIDIYQRNIESATGKDASQYDRHKAWNDARNIGIEGRGAWLFRYTPADACPPGQDAGQAGVHTTYYKALTGPGTAFDPTTPSRLTELPNDLIMVARVEQSDTHWMEPGDLSIQELTQPDKAERLLLGKDGYAVLFADGEGWVLSRAAPIVDVCKFFSITGAQRYDRDKILGPYRVLR